MVVVYIIAWVLSVFLNRWLYFQLQKIDEDYYPNPMIFLMVGIPVFGTIVLLLVLLIEVLMKKKTKIGDWLRYKRNP